MLLSSYTSCQKKYHRAFIQIQIHMALIFFSTSTPNPTSHSEGSFFLKETPSIRDPMLIVELEEEACVYSHLIPFLSNFVFFFFLVLVKAIVLAWNKLSRPHAPLFVHQLLDSEKTHYSFWISNGTLSRKWGRRVSNDWSLLN